MKPTDALKKLAGGAGAGQPEKSWSGVFSSADPAGRPEQPGRPTSALRDPDDGCGHDDGGDDGDRLRWPRRALTWLVVLVALGCGWQVLPERLVRLHGFTADQHARSAEAAPLPNRGERWIVDMERMALAWLEPGDRVAVWSPQGADRIPTNQFDRIQ